MSAAVLLDTNIVSFLLREAPAPLVARIASTPRERLAVSVITAMELRFGVARNAAARRTREAVARFLDTFPVAPLPDDIDEVYGRVRADLERRGQPIGALDTIIASHAVALGATLVTNNMKEFRRVRGLRCEDWTRPPRG